MTNWKTIESAPWYRKPLCMAGLCQTFSTMQDDTGCWGQCSICGKRAGFVSRADLRRYIDNELLHLQRQNKSERGMLDIKLA